MMGRGIEGLEQAYNVFLTALLIVLAVLVVLCLIRAIIGPRVADRIVAVNMMGTMVIVMIAVLALMLGEGYLVDICIIYALISFLAVVVLTKVYMGVYLERKKTEQRETGQAEHDGPGTVRTGAEETGYEQSVSGCTEGTEQPENGIRESMRQEPLVSGSEVHHGGD